jgi:rhodanese-related sulfurtransferase
MQLYRGDLLPKESWDLLSQDPEACLVDVRTNLELKQIGIPDLAALNKETVTIEWKIAPNMQINSNFLEDLTKKINKKSTTLIFVCRTGARSAEAASMMAGLGFTNCFNVLNGFEGDQDLNGQRGAISGWKADKLPWRFI